MIRRLLVAISACAGLMFPAAAFAQTCSIQLTNKPRDIITGTATLFTNDPNENGEGEPLVIFSSGGEYSATIGAYSLPTPFSFPAAVANVSISGTIQGADGDESCSVTATVNPASAFSPDDKKKANRLALIFGITTVAIGTIIAAAGCTLTAGVLCAILIGAAAGGGIDTSVFAYIAGDPSDPNFTQIALPIIPVIPPITPDSFITQASADAANALFLNQATVGAVGKAAFISGNRAQGAHDAQATDWEIKQIQAAQLYSIELGGLLSQQIGLRQNLRDALVANGVSLTVSAAEVFFYELELAFSAQLPEPLFSALQTFGADQATLDQLRSILIAQDVNAAAGTFPDILVSPDTLSALQDAATTFSGVGIQIKPGSPSPAPINPASSGKIPVAILGSSTFDVTTVDPSTVKFGPSGAASTQAASLEDVNGDGILDLVVHFPTKDTGINCGDKMAVLTGKTFAKELFSGGESIRTVGCN